MWGGRAWLALAAWLIVVAGRAEAASTAMVDAAARHLSLADNLEVFEDASGALTIDEVRSARFVPFSGRANYGFTPRAIWVRFTVENDGNTPLERWLVEDLVPTDNVQVFRDGEPPAVQGRLHPRAERELPRRSYSFRIALGPRQTRTVYVRAWGHAEVQLPVDLWELGALAAHDRSLATWGAFLLGVALALALYNLFLFFFVGDRLRLYYAAWVFFALLWGACLDGALLDFLPQRVQILPHPVNLIFFGLLWMFAWLSVRRVLDLPGTHPRIDRAFMVLQGIGMCALAAWFIDYRTQNLLLAPLALATLFAWIGAAALRWREGLSAARYVVFAWSTFFIVAALAVLSVDGTIPVRLGEMPQLANALEAVLFSLALADASRQRDRQLANMHRESELLNQELRRQIADRAGQLAGAIARLSPAPRTLSPGEVIEDRYRVVRALGKGGMGTVYEVERASDGRKLALKVLTGTADREALARFAREAQIAAQLDHPNVVSVLDVDVSRSGTLFLVMELVAGSTLATERARYGDAPWAVSILRHVAAALSAMHARGIVHRDLKPANVLIDGTIVKVADFGIASLVAPPPPGGGDSTVSLAARAVLTQTGAFMGTPLYMAPELVHGARDAQPSADLWSFGVIAHELLSGALPFSEAPVLACLQGRAPEAAPMLAAPLIDAELRAALDRCLLVDPSARPTAEAIVLIASR